jgi:hypothetical protein
MVVGGLVFSTIFFGGNPLTSREILNGLLISNSDSLFVCSWHVEDMDLYGVNFLHHGAPKTWYCVPPQYGYKLERIAAEVFPTMAQVCANMLRHKACTISPLLLEEHGLQVDVQIMLIKLDDVLEFSSVGDPDPDPVCFLASRIH